MATENPTPQGSPDTAQPVSENAPSTAENADPNTVVIETQMATVIFDTSPQVTTTVEVEHTGGTEITEIQNEINRNLEIGITQGFEITVLREPLQTHTPVELIRTPEPQNPCQAPCSLPKVDVRTCYGEPRIDQETGIVIGRGVVIGPGVNIMSFPRLGKIIEIPEEETPTWARQFQHSNEVPICKPPRDECCPMLTRDIFLDPEPNPCCMGEPCKTDFSVADLFQKPPTLALKDGEPCYEDDSDFETDIEEKLERPAYVHITPTTLVRGEELLYHVNVYGKNGMLEVDRLCEGHPIPNCRLRQIRREEELFPDGQIHGLSCSDIFIVNPPEPEDNLADYFIPSQSSNVTLEETCMQCCQGSTRCCQ